MEAHHRVSGPNTRTRIFSSNGTRKKYSFPGTPNSGNDVQSRLVSSRLKRARERKPLLGTHPGGWESLVQSLSLRNWLARVAHRVTNFTVYLSEINHVQGQKIREKKNKTSNDNIAGNGRS